MSETIELAVPVVKRRVDGPIFVTETDSPLSGLQRTDRECHVCEDGTFLKDGSELICDTCQYAPPQDGNRETVADTKGPWERFREHRRRAAEDGARPYCVGGVPDAYFGEGEYCYRPEDGFTAPTR